VFQVCYNFRPSLTVISLPDLANTILSHFKKYENHLCCIIENILLFSVSHAEHNGTCPTRTSYYEVARNSEHNFLWIAVFKQAVKFYMFKLTALDAFDYVQDAIFGHRS